MCVCVLFLGTDFKEPKKEKKSKGKVKKKNIYYTSILIA